MKNLITVLIAVLALSSCTSEKYPVLGTDPLTEVAMFEDHSEALARWAEAGIRDAVLVNIDAHDDMRRIPPAKIERLRALYARKDWASMRAAASLLDDSLYNIGNFIYAAAKLGIVKEVYWVIPFSHFSNPEVEKRLRVFLKTYDTFSREDVDTFRMRDGCFRGSVRGIALSVCGLEALPDINEPVLLSIDADFFPPMAFDYGLDKLTGLREFFGAMYRKKYRIRDTVVAYSVNVSEYTTVTNRWLGDVSAAILKEPEIIYGDAPELWSALRHAEDDLKQNRPGAVLRYLGAYLERYPDEASLLMYMAVAYYEAGDIDRAFSHAEKSCLSDRGYCYGLPHLGMRLAASDRASEAERFFLRGYELNPGMNFGQAYFANMLRKMGRYEQALEYYGIFRELNGSYPVDFMTAETYLMMGDEEAALEYFDRGRKYLGLNPYARVKHKDEADAVAAAVEFYERKGMEEAARELREDPRLKAAFESRPAGTTEPAGRVD